MTGSFIFLTFTTLIAMFIAMVVSLAHNVRRATKMLFFGVCAALSLWQITIFIADEVVTHLRFWNNILFLWPSLAVIGIFLFSLLLESESNEVTIASRIKQAGRSSRIMFWALSLQILLIGTGQIFSRVTFERGDYVFVRGWAYPFYVVLLGVQLIVLIWYLLRSYRQGLVHSQTRKAFGTVLGTICVVSAYSVLTNIILPLLTHSQQHISWGILSIDLFAIGFALSIIRYRFLDIRSYAFTAATYISALFVMAIVYVTIASFLTTKVFHVELTTRALVVLSIFTMVIALSFQPLQRYFNRLTGRLFYRDAYEPQELFNELNQSLVGAIRIEPMLERALEIIQKNIKSEFALVLLRQTDAAPTRTVSTTLSKVIPLTDIKAVDTKRMLMHHNTVIITSDLAPKSELRTLLARNDIEVLARLRDSNDETSDIGCLVLGAKKSGNPFMRQDERVLEAVSNELVIAIQNALRFEEIENFNATLQQKVDAATRKLRRTNEKLRQLDETKDDFISMASHQLRTPLTSVKGYVSMVLDGDGGKLSPLQRKLLNQSFISAQRMVYLISDLLNVSRLRTGRFVIERVPTNLARVVQEEVKQLIETAKGRNLELIYHKPDHFPILMLDETKLRQVIMNFIDNAIYYTPSGGHITVNLVDKPQTVELTVVDDGMGVPRGEQHRLFTKFYRAQNAKRARPDGTGLGLFMAKKVIAAQDGAIIFKSTEGKGSTFGFTFVKEPLLAPNQDQNQ